MNGRTSSVFARTPGNMFAGEQEGNEFLVDRGLPRRILIGESSIHARGGSDEGKEGKGLDGDGFPEDVGFGWNEKNAFVERIEELEKELYDYQYHMGLLLIERKMRASEFEELRKRMSEAKAKLKLESAAFSSTLSEKQKQEQSILIILEAKKQKIAVLEKLIYKMQTEEKRLTEQREALQSWAPSLLEHELELKGSQDFLGERKMNIAEEKEEFSEIQEKTEENQNSLVRMNNASNYNEADISDRQQTLASKEKEAESKQEKLENKGRDLLASPVKLSTGESALQSEKQAFDQELESGRESLDGKLKDKLNKLGKQNVIEGEYGSQMIDDFLAHEKRVETEKVRLHKDKETCNTFYNKLHGFIQEPIKKRDFLLFLRKHCKACMNCNFIFSEIEYGSQMIDDFLAHEKGVEAENVRLHNDNETCNTFYNKLHGFIQEPIKKRDFLLSLRKHCKACMNCNFIFSEIDLASPENFEGAELKGGVLLLSIPNEHLQKRPMEGQNDDSCCQSKGYESIKIGGCRPCLQQCLEIENDAFEIECQPNVSSINVQNESHALTSKDMKGRPMPNKRTGSLKLVVENYKETLDDAPKEIKQLEKCCSEDLKDANEQSKLNLLNAAKMRGSAEHRELLCHASETTFEFDPYDTEKQPVNGHRKRQRIGDIIVNFPGQKRYNFRPSTILKALISKLQAEQVAFGRGIDETDIEYEPNNSD